MKTRIILFAAAALTVLTACSSDDSSMEENRVPVTLAYTTVDATETRAAQNLNEGTFAAGESVKVRISNTGAGSWTDYTFTTADAGAMTPSGSTPYYPAGSQNIDIVAYYPASAGTSFSVATDQTADDDYKASDLMFASVADQAKQAAAVNLAFAHKMAKLCVNITAGAGVSSITSVSLLNVKPTVSFNQATGEVGEATGTATTIAMSNNGAAVIPAQTINGNLLSIATDQGTATYSVDNKAFAAGQLYTLNITVNLRAVGTTTAITGWTSEGTVTVNPVQEVTNAPAGAVAVDLGLSVKWANMNVGATTVTDYGTYFAWGETSGYTDNSHYAKKYFWWDSYAWCHDWGGDYPYIIHLNKYCPSGKQGSYWWDSSGWTLAADNKTQLELADDAARANWGGSWRMPTKDEINALINTKGAEGYTWTWKTNYNDVSGCNGWEITCTATNGTIFLPAAGSREETTTSEQGQRVFYWSSSLYTDDPSKAWRFCFNSNSGVQAGDNRCTGMSVRPVLAY